MNTEFKVSGSCNLPDYCEGSGSAEETQDSVQYGAGIETLISPKVGLCVEYLMADYGDAGLGEGVELDHSTVRAGLSYRF